MSKGNTFENDILKLIFNAVGIADLADNDATSPATTLTVALHTADPGEAGDQTTSETAYTGYAGRGAGRRGGVAPSPKSMFATGETELAVTVHPPDVRATATRA